MLFKPLDQTNAATIVWITTRARDSRLNAWTSSTKVKELEYRLKKWTMSPSSRSALFGHSALYYLDVV